jgi:hypothetical protein
MEEFLSVGMSVADRKRKLLELLRQGPARGLIAVALHEDGKRAGSSKFMRPYQNKSDLELQMVAESVDRYLVSAYSSGIHPYDGATIKVFDRPSPMAASE